MLFYVHNAVFTYAICSYICSVTLALKLNIMTLMNIAWRLSNWQGFQVNDLVAD